MGKTFSYFVVEGNPATPLVLLNQMSMTFWDETYCPLLSCDILVFNVWILRSSVRMTLMVISLEVVSFTLRQFYMDLS